MKALYHTYLEQVDTHFVIPPVPLQPFIEKYMFYEVNASHISNVPFRALPNGNVEIFLHVKGNNVHFFEKKPAYQLTNFIAGIFELSYPMNIKITYASNSFRGLSITLSHSGVNKFLNRPISDVTNRIIKADYFWGFKGKQYITNILQAEKDRTKIHLLNQLFTWLLHQSDNKKQQEIQPILEFLENKSGKITVDEIAHHLSLSYKSIYRKFNNHIGISPKTYLKIIRFNRACRLLYHFPSINWGELVYHCGYYDQAHFINEFHHIMKESPLDFIKLTGGKFYLNRPLCFH